MRIKKKQQLHSQNLGNDVNTKKLIIHTAVDTECDL